MRKSLRRQTKPARQSTTKHPKPSESVASGRSTPKTQIATYGFQATAIFYSTTSKPKNKTQKQSSKRHNATSQPHTAKIMHLSSLQFMQSFHDRHLINRKNDNLLIYDIGSTDFGGSYKSIFENEKWEYVGVDLAKGPNVDMVIKQPYDWREIKSNSVDVLISGQALEHIEFFWITILEVSRVLKPGGMACIIAPSAGYEHRYPVDCWRFYPDGMKALARFGRLTCVEAFTHWGEIGDPGSDPWHDTVLVAQKPVRSLKKHIGVMAMQLMQKKIMGWRLPDFT